MRVIKKISFCVEFALHIFMLMLVIMSIIVLLGFVSEGQGNMCECKVEGPTSNNSQK